MKHLLFSVDLNTWVLADPRLLEQLMQKLSWSGNTIRHYCCMHFWHRVSVYATSVKMLNNSQICLSAYLSACHVVSLSSISVGWNLAGLFSCLAALHVFVWLSLCPLCIHQRVSGCRSTQWSLSGSHVDPDLNWPPHAVWHSQKEREKLAGFDIYHSSCYAQLSKPLVKTAAPDFCLCDFTLS